MSILISVLLLVEVLAAFLLIVVILAQKSKDQGLGMAFGGGMGESLFGSRAGNVLTRMTITLAVVFMLTTITLGILFSRGATAGGSVMDRADRQLPMAPALPAQAAPQMPAALPEMPAALPEAGELPMAVPAEAPSAPVVMQMGEGGELEPVATDAAPAPAVEETAPAAEEAE